MLKTYKLTVNLTTICIIMNLVLLSTNALGKTPSHYDDRLIVTTPVSMTLYGWLSINGKPASSNTEIAVFNPQGVLCGMAVVSQKKAGAFLMQVYGDDATSPSQDEGLRAGEILRFEVYAPGMFSPLKEDKLFFESAGMNDPPSLPVVFTNKASYGIKINVGY